ncbi:helix-turn-helix transcriptional regulator [Kitasatospora camelliae]|uniref:WYL domain-containing protein n=1 Tax=Kitasatospora camelliae TaxID=3156397 RepID=A0AAU8JS19_9ACTN
MRADRLLALLLLLQNRGRMTAPELAAELEVSVRTVYRDIEALGASGVPVLADRGPDGGYRLVDGYRTRLTGLTDAEAGSLFLAGLPGQAAELGLGPDLALAQLKLGAALPAEHVARARRIQERFHLDAPAWFREADPVPHLAAVAEAVWEQRRLRAGYRRWNGEEVRRELLPLGIVLKGGIWYLVAAAEPSGEPEGGPDGPGGPGGRDGRDGRDGRRVRTYRISRFLAVERLAAGFERPGGFRLAAHWEESARRLEEMRHQRTAVLRVSPRAVRLLPMKFGALGVRAVETAGEPDAEGWVEVRLAVESPAVAVGDLLGLGPEAELLGPPDLVRDFTAALTAMARRYGLVADAAAEGPERGDG